MLGGFGGPGGGFLIVVAVVALPLLPLLLKPPPGPPKPPSNLVRVENLTRAISGAGLELSAGTIASECRPYDLSPKDISAQSYLQGSVYAL